MITGPRGDSMVTPVSAAVGGGGGGAAEAAGWKATASERRRRDSAAGAGRHDASRMLSRSWPTWCTPLLTSRT